MTANNDMLSGLWRRRVRWNAVVLPLLLYHLSPIIHHPDAEAAVSKGTKQQLEAGGTNQGGGIATSSKFRQTVAVGESVATTQVSSARFRVIPGFLGATVSGAATVPTLSLDIEVLRAKTQPLGSEIIPRMWQTDRDPLFFWEPPKSGEGIAGYSLALDADPDDVS